MKTSVRWTLTIGVALGVAMALGLAGASGVTSTATHPVTLCVNKLLRIVSAPPTTGVCAASTTTLHVASSTDVAALAGRLDAADNSNASQDRKIAELQAELDGAEQQINRLQVVSQNGSLVATALPADANGNYEIHIHGENLPSGSGIDTVLVLQNDHIVGASDATGYGTTYDWVWHSSCGNTPLQFGVFSHFANVDADYIDVLSNVIATAPGCP